MTTTTKKIKLTLVGLNGNAFALMGAFSRQAKKEGWSREEIDEVIKKATSGNYSKLLRVLQEHCEDDKDDE